MSILEDRKSTRLNSSHPSISYAVFCLKKKNQRRAQIVSLASGRIGRACQCQKGFFYSKMLRPTRSTLFPYTTLFRSRHLQRQVLQRSRSLPRGLRRDLVSRLLGKADHEHP